MGANHNSRIGAVILAAGMSTRMGEVKQLLRLGENTLLGQVLDNVRGAGVTEIILVLGFAADQIKQHVAIDGLRVVVNESYRQGMGTSLRAGLAAVDPGTEAALIVLADQPFVRSATLDQLIDQYHRSHAQIVIPLFKGFRGNPVLLDRSVFAEVMNLGGDIGCRAIFGSHLEGIVKVPVDDIGILLDIDSQDDFEKLQRFSYRSENESTLLTAADLEGREIKSREPSSQAQAELIIVGREPVTVALAKLGKLLHFTVTVVDPLLTIAELPEADRVLNTLDLSQLPEASARYAIVASRGKFDEEAIEQALLAKSAYVALVAKKSRGQEILRGLERKGISPEKLARVRAPAGIDIGAESAEEIALSIMAEIVSHRRAQR